ncbi:syncoilin isoform X1 [Pelobates cultripes]|uniref:Syncoilin isoform X1 n=1 Tax=Pelobates cultripes TaxID=61616 RepID=A0AAD1R2E9_PELCU|nr:syncoilin isoform X1 [Pelobates cultripes]
MVTACKSVPVAVHLLVGGAPYPQLPHHNLLLITEGSVCADEMSSAEEERQSSPEERENQDPNMPSISPPVTQEPLSLQDLGVRFQFCIAAVEDLERERDELIRELAVLREPSVEAVRQAHEQVVQAFGQRARVELERDALKEEIRVVRCRLFRVTRECVACQYQLDNQRKELEQKAAEQDDLEKLGARLEEELTQLHETSSQQRDHQQQCLRTPRSRRTSRELQDRRRLSAELQSIIEEQQSSLEEMYEPRLLQLLERCERGARALHTVQEELQKLREELRPLQGEAYNLQVQQRSLQEQISLLKKKRDNEVLLYRSTTEYIQDTWDDIRVSACRVCTQYAPGHSKNLCMFLVCQLCQIMRRGEQETDLVIVMRCVELCALSVELSVWVRFQFCIAAVEDLERERDELIRELAVLREPSVEAVRQAHEQVVQAFGQRARVELERDALKEEIRVVRCRLFRVTRECVACQYQLDNQRKELEQKAAEQDDLEKLGARLEEELTQLHETSSQQRDHQQQCLRTPRSRRTSRELQDRRRLSAELQSIIEEQQSSLEEMYEPRLLQLLERCERGARALHTVQEELQKLREELRPLQGEAYNLQVQQRSLQEQISLLKKKRDNEVLLYREQLQELENTKREIKISVQLQQHQNKEMEELRKSLAQELAIYKGCLEIYGQLFKSVTKKE